MKSVLQISALLLVGLFGCASVHGAHLTRLRSPKDLSYKQVPGAQLRLPGPCVAPPQRDYVIESTTREANPQSDEEPRPRRWRFHTRTALDADGDGQADVIVPQVAPRACPHEVEYTIYVMRGACGHAVGMVLGFPSIDEAAAPVPAGQLRGIITSRTWSEITDRSRPMGPHNVATRHSEQTPYRARGGFYRAGTLTHTAGICHHYGMPTCRLVSGP